MYGLKQAPRSWYARLNKFLLENGFSMGKVDTTHFIKYKNKNILIVQIFVDDIIFFLLMSLCIRNFHLVRSKSLMCMMEELKYFIGLQIRQNKEGIFINPAQYLRDLLNRFGFEDGKTKSTPMSSTIKLDKDEKR